MTTGLCVTKRPINSAQRQLPYELREPLTVRRSAR